MVYSAGTLPIGNDGEVIAPHCAHQQALAAFRKALTAIEQLGASANDVVRCRMYVRHMNDQVEVGRAMHELFGKVRPVATMIGGVDLAHPSALVEIEIEAVLDA